MQETTNAEGYAPAKKLDPDFWMEKLDSIMVRMTIIIKLYFFECTIYNSKQQHKSHSTATLQNENANNKVIAEHSSHTYGKVITREVPVYSQS